MVKSDFDSNGISAEAGLEGSGLTARAQTKVKPLIGTSEHLSGALRTVGKEKPCDPDNDSVSEAVRLAQEGDAAAFEFIYRLYCRRVYALCRRMVKDTNEAEDLAQEAFMQVFRKIHTFRGEAAFSSWLYRLTANIVIMRLRRKKLTSTSLDQVFVGDDGNDGSYNEPGAPDLRMTGLFDRCNLQQAVNQLPEGNKATFILHDVQGYEHKQIARILGCSVGSCRSQLYRARKGIRKFLQSLQHYGSETDRGRANRTLAPVSR
jgi:RNA polymerase sigma-70 factor (ECF subfamily)